MKTSDINAFKGQVKDALYKWAASQIDHLLPNKVTARVMLKNLAGNTIARFSCKIDQGIDAAFLMLGDKDGNIDSDTAVDFVCNLLKEMEPTDYAIGPVGAVVGKGEIKLQFPRGIISDLMVGNLEGVKITTSDIQEIKNIFK